MALKKKKPLAKAVQNSAPKKAQKPKQPGRLFRLAAKLGLKNRWQRVLFYIFGSLAVLILLYISLEFLIPQVKNPNYGVSFSEQYAKELGVDWQANYIALLDDMKLRNFRLMTYWDDGEPQKGVYNFTDLDWQVNQAAQRGAKVSLSIGLRQPRWPECHEPAWAKELPAESPEWTADLSDYIKTTVNRYKNNPALSSYQLENESLNTWFGDCRTKAANRQRLIDEFNLVKQLDPNHPVLMSLSDEHGLPVGQPTPDAYGFSVYRIVWNDKTPIHFYVTYPAPDWWHRLRSGIIKITKHRNVFIHELQMEPWGPKPTKEMSIKDQDRSMGTQQIKKNMVFGRKVGAKDIYIWGGEWWYWRKTTLNDPRPWNAVKQELTKYQTGLQ